MNKSLILVASTCLVAIVVVQVSAMQFGAINPGYGMTGGYNQDAYYRRYQAYNDAQQLRVLQKTVKDLSFSSTLSLGKLTPGIHIVYIKYKIYMYIRNGNKLLEHLWLEKSVSQ